ncbi:hypothetical protein [Pseudomonas sp. DE0010]|uniref:hypothetical protein n=1 Tax=Pseudomonas sp. DE0010 TaxID=2584951 RepID=UPI0015B48C90|nr:hypothetical protein [Pseudomonas sp. DE0010]
MKFSNLILGENWHAVQVLKGGRLLNSCSLFRVVEIPNSLLDGLLYWDLFYHHLGGEY